MPGIVWHNVQEFSAAIESLDARVRIAAKQAGLEAGGELATATKAMAPKGETGQLSASIKVQPQTVSGVPLVRVGPTVIYGRRVDLGFKGKTRGGKAKRRGIYVPDLVFGGRVRLGWTNRGLNPTPPRKFLEKALAASRGRMAATYHRAFARAITKT